MKVSKETIYKLVFGGLLVLVVVVLSKYRFDVVFAHEVFDPTFSGKDTLKYRLFTPIENVKGQKYPLVIYLHGSSSRGWDNEKQVRMIRPFLLADSVRRKFPCFVLAPQCMKNPYQWNDMRNRRISSPLVEVEELTERLLTKYPIDTNRIYLIGYSMGAAGAWESIISHPNRYAGAVVMSGWATPDSAYKIKHLPIWAFHGAKDRTVSPESTRQMVEKLKHLGAPIKYTEYPSGEHNTWAVLKEPALLPWLFSNNKRSN